MATYFNTQLLAQHLGMTLDQMQHHPELLINAFDHGHIVLFWNDRCEDYFGISPAEALGKKLETLLPETKIDERMSWIDRCLEGQQIEVLKGEYRRKRGYYEQRIIPVKDEDGIVCAALNVVRSI